MEKNDKKIILNSKLRSILDYGLPLYMGENENTKSRLEAAYMLVNKIIHGGYTFKINNKKICSEAKVEMPRMHMSKTAVTFIHKQLSHQKCKSIVEKLKIPKRKISHIYVRNPQNGTYPASLDRLVELYNKLPPETKTKTMGQFKSYLRKNDIKTR